MSSEKTGSEKTVSLETVHLHIPSLDELRYRQKIMQDPATMAYNKGYDIESDNYDRETGCILFPREDWAEWYDYFVGREPERFYAYIVAERDADGAFVGEVNLHRSGCRPWHEIGIVIEARYRGQGYSRRALKLLLRHAFDEMDAAEVRNDFEETRIAAMKTHLSVGFEEYKRENGIVLLGITRDKYYNQNPL